MYYITKENGLRIKQDYSSIVGKTYNVKGAELKVTQITLLDLPESEYCNVTVDFEIVHGSFLPTMLIELFCQEVGIPFNIKNYGIQK
jgi:hypothetical protein